MTTQNPVISPEEAVVIANQEQQRYWRKRCRAHILTAYPEWQQINILRVGTPEEKERMGQFIDACRAWSNDANPDPAALATIQP